MSGYACRPSIIHSHCANSVPHAVFAGVGVTLDDCNFHEGVRMEDFEKDRTLAIVPPDGEASASLYMYGFELVFVVCQIGPQHEINLNVTLIVSLSEKK